MTTRRTFFNKCALFVAGCQLGLQLQSKKPTLEINPAWVDAEYEVYFWSAEAINIGPPPTASEPSSTSPD